MEKFQGLLSPFGKKTVLLLVFLAIFPYFAYGNPFTKKQMVQVKKLLEEGIKTVFPSDDQDKYSDLLVQVLLDAKNLTYYHIGNPDEPVFISFGVGNIGKKIHVLSRGEDYMNSRDKNNFVVLMQQSSSPDRYSLHMAHVLNNQNIPRSRIIWNDGRVEQQKGMKKLLKQMGNYDVEMRSRRKQRPTCQWLGYMLLCDAKKRSPPIRDRVPREPLDKEDSAPVKLVQNSEESGGPASAPKDKQKRNIVHGSSLNQVESGYKHKAPVLSGDGIDEEDEEALVFSKSATVIKPQESRKAPAVQAVAAPTTTVTPATTTPETSPPLSPTTDLPVTSQKKVVEKAEEDPNKKKRKRNRHNKSKHRKNE